MLDSAAALFVAVLGLSIGSFLNVATLRFGFSERSKPRWECAQCGASLRWYDLTPVISYLALGGRCRDCGSRISLQYPLVEIVTSALFVIAYLILPPVLTVGSFILFAGLCVFIASSVVVSVYDIRHTLIPLPFIFALSGGALLYRVGEFILTTNVTLLFDASLGAIMCAGILYAVYYTTRGRGMGIGDAYVAGAVGFLLGSAEGISSLILGVWVATVFYIVLLIANRFPARGGIPRVTMKTELPFAPWLLIGAALALFTDLSPFALGDWIAAAIWFT